MNNNITCVDCKLEMIAGSNPEKKDRCKSCQSNKRYLYMLKYKESSNNYKSMMKYTCECGQVINKYKMNSQHLKYSITHYKNLNIPLPINHPYYTPIETNK